MKYAIAIAFALMPTLAFAAVPQFNIREVIWDVVILIGVGIIFGLLTLAIDRAPFLGEPWKQSGKYALLVVAIIIVIYLILQFLGM